MARVVKIDFDDGVILGAMSSSFGMGSRGLILVPASMVSDPDIVSKIRRVAPYAHQASIHETACFADRDYLKRYTREDLASAIEEFEDLDREFWDDVIADAYTLMRAEVARRREVAEKRRVRRSRAKPERQRARSQYHKLFVAIGRRDGFSCARCGESPSDLQVDHVFPIARGGKTAMGNLQLLCPECNRNKGAQTMGEWLADGGAP